MLTKEQSQEIKKQLISQINANFPEEQKIVAVQQIEAMNSEDLEQFLLQNNLIKHGEDIETSKCIFCSIIKGEANSHKIDENKEAIAVLEINPISEGHILIIPKKHISSEKIPSEAFSLGQKVSETLKRILKPKKVDILSSDLFGHGILNVLPIYKDENSQSPRKQASQKELKEIQEKLTQKESQKKQDKKEDNLIKIQSPKILKNIKIPKRIP